MFSRLESSRTKLAVWECDCPLAACEGMYRRSRGRKVTMQAQKIPRFGSITPYTALGTLSYVLSLDWVDWTTVRRRRTEMMHALLVDKTVRAGNATDKKANMKGTKRDATHIPPKDKTMEMANFWFQGSLRCLRMNSGAVRTRKSVQIVSPSCAYQILVMLRHLAPGTCRSHMARNGVQRTKLMVPIVRDWAIMMAVMA